jgi:hypothetical protein
MFNGYTVCDLSSIRIWLVSFTIRLVVEGFQVTNIKNETTFGTLETSLVPVSL